MRVNLNSNPVYRCTCPHILFLWIFVLLPAGCGFSAFEPKFPGSRYAGAGYTGTTSDLPLFPVTGNPAKLAGISSFGIDADYRNYYGIKSLGFVGVDLFWKWLEVPFGFGITEFGNRLYKETELTAAIGHKIGNVWFGISAQLYVLEISRYGRASSAGWQLGCIYPVNNMVTAGFCLKNLNEPVIGKTNERIPKYMVIGIEYRPFTEIRLRAEIGKIADMSFEYHYGMEYLLARHFIIMCGYKESTGSVCMGTSFLLKNFEIGYALEYHPFLGGIKTVSVRYGL
jgi:hypothetical protein